jgi:hypothetical protein
MEVLTLKLKKEDHHDIYDEKAKRHKERAQLQTQRLLTTWEFKFRNAVRRVPVHIPSLLQS